MERILSTLHSALSASPISRVILLTASSGTHAMDCILFSGIFTSGATSLQQHSSAALSLQQQLQFF
jgi:hypothetical protein